MEKTEKYNNKEKLNILNLNYIFNLDPKLEREAKLLNFLCHSDEIIEFELFYLSNNTFLYHNKIKDFSKTFEGLDLNDLINFIYVPNINSLILLFRKGDLFIIPVIYLETDLFDDYWNKIIREINLNDSYDYSSNETSTNNASSFSYFTDFLICSSNNKSENQNNYKTTNNNFNRNNISKLSIRHKNINNSFLNKNEKKLLRNKSSDNSSKYNSKDPISNYFDGQKGKKKIDTENKQKFNLDNNVSLIYWEDDYSHFNSFTDFNEHNNSLGALGLNMQENEKILIMNVENNLLFLELNNLECTILKFNHDIEQLLYVDYYKEEKKTDITKIINSDNKNKENIIKCDYKKSIRIRYDFLIIETKCEFYSLVLSDSNDYVNIRGQKISQIKPKKLKFPIGAIVFVQNYNSERIVVNYFNKVLDLYNIFSLDEPMLSYNLSDIYKSKDENFDVIKIFFYEKLLMILTREINHYAKEDEETKEIIQGQANIYSIKVLNAGKYQNNQLNQHYCSSSENFNELENFELKNKQEEEEDIINISNKLKDESTNKDEFYFAMEHYVNKLKMNKENNELFELSDIKNQPVWSNKDYDYLNKKAKYISEFTLNQRSRTEAKKQISSQCNNNKVANKHKELHEFSNLKINKIEHVLPKNAIINKKLNQYKLKNYKELKIKNLNSDKDKDNIEILYVLTDNALLSIQIPNLDFNKFEQKPSNRAITRSIFSSASFIFENFIANLNMDYKTMRKLELLNHYLNGRFYEFIDKWLEANKNNLKIDKEKYLKIKLLWDFNLAEEKNADLNPGKYKEIFKSFNLNENQETLVLSLLTKIKDLDILCLLKETIMDFLSEDIWHSVNFHELKEKILLEKINSFKKKIELINQFCLFNILDKNNQIEKTIFISMLLIKIFKSYQLQYELAYRNFLCKNPNKVFLNYINQLTSSIKFLESLKANQFIEAILNNFQQEEENQTRLKNAVVNIENKFMTQKNQKLNKQKEEKLNENEETNLSRDTGNQSNLLSESSSLLNLDCSVSLRDNKSIINMFKVNPINDNLPSVSDRDNNLNAFKKREKNKLRFNQFDIGKILNNRLKFKKRFYANNFSDQKLIGFNAIEENLKNPYLISIEDFKANDIFSIASGNSEAFSNNFEFRNLNVNIDSNIFTINQDSIFNSINIFVLDFFILERILENLHSKKQNFNLNENILDLNNYKKEVFYKKFITLYLNKSSNNNLEHSPKSSENLLDPEANIIRKNDLASVSKIIFKNFLVYNLKASNNLEDLVDNLKFYCIDYILENHSVLDKVFEENLFFKFEILLNKVNNNLIIIKLLIELTLFFVNTIEINHSILKTSEENNASFYNQNDIYIKNQINDKQNKCEEIKLNFNLLFQNHLNKLISEKIKNEAKETRKAIENKLLFNDSNEALMNKILLNLYVFESKISKQIKFINNNLMKIKLHNVTKLYQMLFFYLFDTLISFINYNEFKKENIELLNLFKTNNNSILISIRTYFSIFFNVEIKENQNSKEKEKQALLAHLKNNFGDFIFYEKFEIKIKNIIKFLFSESNSAQESLIKEAKPKTLLTIVKSLSNLVNGENQSEEALKLKNIEALKDENSEDIISLLDFNQRKLINLIKKNSKMN